MRRVRLIAFYLPQYHPIPENNLWWGAGFTEWTNTAKAKPLFEGHEVPTYPGDLGYYDLRVPEIREAQAELARAHGVEAFCYWHYWFGDGKRLLERPFTEVLSSGAPDFPFCLAWANHTWSGIWHGCPDRTLIEQRYADPDDTRSHFYTLLEAFADPRYLKVDGRNLFGIYQPGDLPEPKHFMDAWQELAVNEGIPEFYFLAITDYPWRIPIGGFDMCTTNPPVAMLTHQNGVDGAIQELVPVDRDQVGFPQVYAYETFVRHAFPKITRGPLFSPCVVPNWDNTPRSGVNGLEDRVNVLRAFGATRALFVSV